MSLEGPEKTRNTLRPERDREKSVHTGLFSVRVPVRVKIAFPFALLALLFALAAAYIVSQVVVDSLEERSANQLIESGKVTADWMVREENRLLKTWRMLAYTEGVSDAAARGDAEALRELALPIAVNYQEEAIEVLNLQGVGLVSLHHRPGGTVEDYVSVKNETAFAGWKFVQDVLAARVVEGRDKFAGLARAPWGDYLYIAGPLYGNDGTPVGAILVGKSFTSLVQQTRQETLAHTTLYAGNGRPLASTLFLDNVPPLAPGDATRVGSGPTSTSMLRDLTVASVNYAEIIGPFETRDGSTLGLIGVALPQTYFVHTTQVTRMQIFVLVTLGILFVIATGVFVADRITHPLLRVVLASNQVAQGNLQVAVPAQGNDEVADLAQSFNTMVDGLREGFIYRDLLGRTVSPEVRDRMRNALASGDLRLEGQDAVATVLMADIRAFTTLAEHAEPTKVLKWLNEFFAELVPVITAHGGVVNKFDGDAVLAFFGILPVQTLPQESAYQGCLAALEMLDRIESINARRLERGDPVFTTGIGLNTGPVTAGGLGTPDRLTYTIIGDTVNTAQRVEDLTRELGVSAILISDKTCAALGERQNDLKLEALGAYVLRGKADPLQVYRLRPTEPGATDLPGGAVPERKEVRNDASPA